ncbi:MAG: hypothetical protein JWO24_817 [Rhodospirillales bacterium]|jgi:hypothetical protein|nr:hypothetical protein [Rhodospirillales bacterium]
MRKAVALARGGRPARFAWTLAVPGGAVVAGGTDVVRPNEAGRIGKVASFLDAGPD